MKHIKRFEDHINEASEDLVTLNVTISNIDQSTAKDFLKMFAFMEYCGQVGTSRTMRGFLDGDGHFRPKINIEGVDLSKIDMGLTDEDKRIDLDLDFGA
jgi:predicted amino acid-binding ACT domain protein